MTEWEKMNGPPVLPPLYTKQVGRPCKSRRKAPGEVICSNGGKKMSRHGVIMHCNYCGEPDHNIKGCKYLKAGVPPPNMQAPSAAQANHEATSPDEQHVQDEDPVITQEHNPAENPIIEDLMVDQMIERRPVPRVIAQGPVPESTFLSAAQLLVNQNQGSTSTIQQGEMAKKLLALKKQRDKELEDKKNAILAARREEQEKKAEEAARKRHLQEEKKTAEEERKRQAAALNREKRKEEAAIKKQAQAETRQILLEVKKTIAAENKAKKDAEKKAKKEQEAAKKLAEKEAAAAKRRADKKAEKEAAVAQRKEEMRLISIAMGKSQDDSQHQENGQPRNASRISMFDIFR
ncbi:hypothetical protein ACQJBY_022362 [Aegilops geniculata]